jgi:hypothetical protein
MAEVLKGITFPGEIPAEAPVTELFNISYHADLAVAAYAALGAVTDKDAVREDYRHRFQSLHDALAPEHTGDAPSIEPFIGLELPNDFAFNALVTAFDKKQPVDTYIFDLLWSQYDANELNSRIMQVSKTPEVTKAGSVRGEALAMLLGGNNNDEPGLYFTGKNLKAQKNAAKDEKTSYDNSHGNSKLLIANPADYIIVNAQRREAGQPLLDRSTFSRFVQLAMKTAYGSSCLLSALSSGGRLRLAGSGGDARSNGGVRLLAGQNPKALEL